MVEASLILNALIIALLLFMIGRSHMKTEEVHHRLDDVIDGVGMFATEVLKRTESILEMGRSDISSDRITQSQPSRTDFQIRPRHENR
jgi:hypothetical protein